MLRILDVDALRIQGPLEQLVPLAAKHGFGGISVPREILQDARKAEEAAAIVHDHGLQWGLLPTPADFFSATVTDAAFAEALGVLARWAEIAAAIGVRYAYNHVWPSSPSLAFHENFAWHVHRLERVQAVLAAHGIRYGLEFLGPHELRTLHRHPFVHTISGVLAIADAAGGQTGFVFDTFHWYCGSRRLDDLYFAAHNCHRMVNVHLNDGVAGRVPDEQRDLERAMPMTTGVIDAALVYRLFAACGYAGPVICEPMRPSTDRFAAMPAEQAIIEVAEAFRRVEAGAAAA